MFLMFFLLSLGCLVVTWGATPLVRRFSSSHNIGDYPGERKVHTTFIPRLGGAAIILGFSAGLAVAYAFRTETLSAYPVSLPVLAIATSFIIMLGVFDDIYGIGSLGKLIVQSAASGLVVYAGLRLDYLTLPFVGAVQLGVLSIPLTFLWLIGVTNAVNLLDGLDGLACGVSAIVAATFFAIGAVAHDPLIMVTMASLFFACLGFLRYNFHPASIFMGDTGSLFLGFVLACVSLRILQHASTEMTPLSLSIVVITLAVPIVDTSVAFFRRIRKGLHPLKPDKEHIHHRLMDLGLTHRQTVVTIYAISIFNGVIAFLLVQLESFYSAILLVVVFGAIFFGIRRLGYVEEMRRRKHDEQLPIQPLSVARLIDKSVLVVGDILALFAAFAFSHWFRFSSGFFSATTYVPLESYIINPAMLLLGLFWLTLFVLAGLYDIPWDVSRVDYGLLIFKTVAIGTLFLFLITMDVGNITLEGRLTTLIYGATTAFFVVLVRMFIVGFERKYEILGFRKRNTLLVGTSPTAAELVKEIAERPALRYKLVGIVERRTPQNQFMGYPIVGDQDAIPELVKRHNVEEVLIATGYDSREEILEIIARCNGMVPVVKLAPESSKVLSGFKTEEVIGHPLIRLYPTNLNTWQRIAKRWIDFVVAILVLIPFLPLWLLIGLAIKLDSRGPVFFTQERVGKKGRLFTLYKFRSMIHDAEKETGPVWASADDKRVTRVGRILRKLRLDEVPQFINVLKGEMSLVGPRPERPFFVEQLKGEISFYTRRLLIRPGITGWAQVKHRYDASLDDVREKIKYDLYYLENMSLTLDLKIILRTVIVALSGKGTP